MFKKSFTVPKGRKEYREYLLSDNWKSLRLIALFVYNYTCRFCKAKYNLQVHHIRYYRSQFNPEHSLYKRMRWLVVVCRSCHEGINKIVKEDKLDQLKATKKFSSIFNIYYRLSVKELRKRLKAYREGEQTTHQSIGTSAILHLR